MGLLRDALKILFYTNNSSAASSDARVPLLNADGTPKGSDTMANLASVLGVKTAVFGREATNITANSDLNDYTTIGAYRCPSSTTAGTVTNGPSSAAYQLWYISPFMAQEDSAANGVQIAFGHTFGIKYRRIYGGIWGDWTSIQ